MHDWWNGLTSQRQDELNTIARRSILQLERYPLIHEVAEEMLAWQRLEIDVLDAYTEWLERTRAQFERRGLAWTTENLDRYSRLWEVE